MDNQHRKITGYRELPEAEIDLMNEIKSMGDNWIVPLVERLRALPEADQRWVSIGVTHLQEGLMALTRGVARPGSF